MYPLRSECIRYGYNSERVRKVKRLHHCAANAFVDPELKNALDRHGHDRLQESERIE